MSLLTLTSPNAAPGWDEELRILRGLLELRRRGRFDGVWAENGRLFVREDALGDRRLLRWKDAAELVAAIVPRKPAARETIAFPIADRKPNENPTEVHRKPAARAVSTPPASQRPVRVGAAGRAR